jgi:hypothetical protein
VEAAHHCLLAGCPSTVHWLQTYWVPANDAGRVDGIQHAQPSAPPKRRKRQPTRSLAPGTSEGGSRPAVTSASRSCVYLSSERCMLPNDKDACYPVQAHSSSFQLIPAHSGSFRLIPARSNHCTGFRDKPLRLTDPAWILKRCEGPKFWSQLVLYTSRVLWTLHGNSDELTISGGGCHRLISRRIPEVGVT